MGIFPLPQGYSLQPVARFQYFKAAGAQVSAHEIAQHHFIFGEQDTLCPRRHTNLRSSAVSSVAVVSTGIVAIAGETSGSENEIVVPCTLLSAQMAFLWSSLKALQMATPSPVPPECCWRPWRAR